MPTTSLHTAPPGEHIHFPEVAWPEPLPPPAAPATTVAAYDPAVDAVSRGLLSASTLTATQIDALQRLLASNRRPIVEASPWDARPPMEDERLRAATEAALDEIISGVAPRRSPLRSLTPSTATWFWMAVSAWLGFLLARAEGVL